MKLTVSMLKFASFLEHCYWSRVTVLNPPKCTQPQDSSLIVAFDKKILISLIYVHNYLDLSKMLVIVCKIFLVCLKKTLTWFLKNNFSKAFV